MLADGYLGAANALRRLGHQVTFSGMMCYSNQDKTTHLERVKVDIGRACPDVVIWWRSETLSAEEFKQMRESVPRECLFVMYSWDAMHLWESHQEGETLAKKCPYLDLAFTCCKTSIALYEKHGCRAVYAPPGFDPSVHYPERAPEWECDISLVCTNLYHGSNWSKMPHISRKALMNLLIKTLPRLDIRIYGPESLKQDFPHHYSGLVGFSDTHKVFYNSKINICTHLRPDAEMYYNERVPQILGSAGLLYVDNVVGLDRVLDIGQECLVMDFSSAASVIAQIAGILSRSTALNEIRKRGYEKAIQKMTWDNWAAIVEAGIKNLRP